MEMYMPSKEEWEAMQRNIAGMADSLQQYKELLKKSNLTGEHFPEYMDISVAARYLKCPVSRIRHMVYVQKLLKIHHIDLTRTVYVAKKEMDDLRFRVAAIREIERKKNKS